MKFITTIFILLFSFSICFAQEYIGPKKDIDQILVNTKVFSSYIVSDNYKMIGESYTVDAKIFPNNTLIIEGKEDIISYWKHPEDIKITYHKITQSEIKVIGEEAYDYGYYEGTTQKADGSESSWKGKYVIVWKKVGTDWKMYLDIWNSVK